MDSWFEDRDLLDDYKKISSLLKVVFSFITKDESEFLKIVTENHDLAFSHAVAFLKKSMFTSESIYSLGFLDENSYSGNIFLGYDLEIEEKKKIFFEYNYQSICQPLELVSQFEKSNNIIS